MNKPCNYNFIIHFLVSVLFDLRRQALITSLSNALNRLVPRQLDIDRTED